MSGVARVLSMAWCGAVASMVAGCALEGDETATSVEALTWRSPSVLDEEADLDTEPEVAVDALGNGVVVWSQGDHLNARRYTLRGGWGATLTLASGGRSIESYDVAMRPDGEAYVVWSQPGTSISSPGGGQVWAGRLTATTWSGALRIATHDAGHPSLVNVETNARGAAFATWTLTSNDITEAPRNFVSRHTADGAWGAAREIVVPALWPPASRQRLPVQIGVDTNGNGVFAWQETAYGSLFSTTFTGNRLWATRFDVEGRERLAPAVRLDGGIPSEVVSSSLWQHCAPSLSVDADGNATVVWMGGITRVFASRGTRAGGWTAATQIEPGIGVDPTVTLRPDGDAVAVWCGWSSTVGEGYHLSTYHGGAWSTPTLVFPFPACHFTSQHLAFDAAGNGLMIYTDFGSQGAIRALRYDAALAGSPAAWTPEIAGPLPPGLVTPSYARMALAPSGVALATWSVYEDDTEVTRIWASVLR